MVDPYPLTFSPILLEKVWGGRRLAAWGKPLPPGKPIGESWELADLDSTSASGAGGAPARSVIADGPLAGRTLRDAAALWGDALLGHPFPPSGFPLLIKLLDARENLSVQVHPSPAYCAATPGPGVHLKTESWYILEAQPGAVVYVGVKPGVTNARLAAAARDGSIVDLLATRPARPGDCHTLPSGTVHALGAGVLVAEVQTPSDTTFRLYDWGRTDRTLHIDEALECADLGPTPPPPPTRRPADAPPGPYPLAATPYYTIHELLIPPNRTAPIDADTMIVLEGDGALAAPDTHDTPLTRAQTVLIPTALHPHCKATASTAGLKLLAITLPRRRA